MDQGESDQIDKLEHEVAKLKHARLCLECGAKDANTVLIPCAHVSVCSDCAEGLKECPKEKKKIELFYKAYL